MDVNLEGELGDGNGGNASETPVVVQGGHAFQEVAAGAAHTCGLTAAGAAYCWGGNDAGQLGHDNAGTDRDKAEVVVGGRTFVTLAAGSSHILIRPWSAVMPLAGWALSRSRTGAPR